MKNIYLFIFILIIFIFNYCVKDIPVDLPASVEKIVVEGQIEQNSFADVILTRNAGYFEPVDSTTVLKILIANAIVVVSEGTRSDTLEFIFEAKKFPYFFYRGKKIRGETGKTYSLTVKHENTVLTSQTTIPQPIAIDSLKFKPVPPHDSLGYIWFYYNDPPSIGNCYRTFTKTIGYDSIFVHPFSSVLDDRLTNGQHIEYPIYHGRNPFLIESDSADTIQNKEPKYLFKIGQRVVLKFCTIDVSHYQFWNTMEQFLSSGNNPFASPGELKSNIDGGLGIWGGYGVCLDTIEIK